MTGVFIQVRLGSTRLPGKALLTLGSCTIIEHAMRKMRDVLADCHALVCDDESEEVLTPLARRCGFEIFGGPREDVLERFVLAIDNFGVDTIVRATGDNPLLSTEYANLSLDAHASAKADYTTYLGLPVGTGVEVVSADALRRARSESGDPYDHEHVTPYVYRSGHFRLNRPQSGLDASLGTAHVTVDTVDDYRRLLQFVVRAGGEDLPDFQTLCSLLREEDNRAVSGD